METGCCWRRRWTCLGWRYTWAHPAWDDEEGDWWVVSRRRLEGRWSRPRGRRRRRGGGRWRRSPWSARGRRRGSAARGSRGWCRRRRSDCEGAGRGGGAGPEAMAGTRSASSPLVTKPLSPAMCGTRPGTARNRPRRRAALRSCRASRPARWWTTSPSPRRRRRRRRRRRGLQLQRLNSRTRAGWMDESIDRIETRKRRGSKAGDRSIEHTWHAPRRSPRLLRNLHVNRPGNGSDPELSVRNARSGRTQMPPAPSSWPSLAVHAAVAVAAAAAATPRRRASRWDFVGGVSRFRFEAAIGIWEGDAGIWTRGGEGRGRKTSGCHVARRVPVPRREAAYCVRALHFVSLGRAFQKARVQPITGHARRRRRSDRRDAAGLQCGHSWSPRRSGMPPPPPSPVPLSVLAPRWDCLVRPRLGFG